jgi:hypothetical protein
MLLGRRHDRRIDDLPAPGEIALVLQEPVKQIEQLFHRARLRQRLAIEPQSLGVGNRILQLQTEKANEGEAITKLVFRLIVGEIVERLQYQKITTSSQGLRPAEFLRSASHGTIAANYKRIVLFGETFIASVQIEKPSNLPGSEHENLESDLRGGGKRLFFEVP